MTDWWPVHSLRLTTPRGELRIPSYDDLVALADLAATGVHDPADMPFGVPWTDAEPAQRARSTMQWHWKARAEWSSDLWHLPFVTVVDGVIVGTQELNAKDFAITREVHTGSWLGMAHQSQGIGTQMRAAVLHLAFAGLDAQWATTGAFTDNVKSNGVSRRLGYVEDGVEVHARRGQPATMQRYRLSRAQWQAHTSVPVDIHGLDACRAMFSS